LAVNHAISIVRSFWRHQNLYPWRHIYEKC